MMGTFEKTAFTAPKENRYMTCVSDLELPIDLAKLMQDYPDNIQDYLPKRDIPGYYLG